MPEERHCHQVIVLIILFGHKMKVRIFHCGVKTCGPDSTDLAVRADDVTWIDQNGLQVNIERVAT